MSIEIQGKVYHNMEDIDSDKVEKDKELKVMKQQHSIVTRERMAMRRRIAEKRLEVMALDEKLEMSKSNIDTIQHEIKELNSHFWSWHNEIKGV